ncbi:heat shock factor protein 2 isoform X2 [Pezoporus wallicus]|uniref:heat shock factor protein 2-like n=1 Tax=Pezoporus flaviventris TaxID=889875 RepID=UPI00254AC176|nr:heat shock factor protein 2 isoform X2 [Pezoporus wallicus]XP_061299445.1 heat shock factor protein 2-like [Pezoporus flaviventris]XP_061315992.1 heat shock factor protein 2 isoform X2 [Pezoporus flaviventris]
MKQQQQSPQPQPPQAQPLPAAGGGVPAFLSKLWALVGEAPSNQLITWSQNGQSFLVLDEQRFAKEILPKYFKHNNMASFVRQLNMYGFRKVVHVDSGIVKLERDGPVEFQHPYFKQGREDLLEHIKRKVSSSRPEENKIRQEDLSKIISNAQKVQIKQETIESQLSALKRENESLWREVAELRAKHLQQQQVIRKIVQFIVTLVQNNQLVSLKRKRPLLLNTNGPTKSSVFQQIVKEPADSNHHVPLNRNEGLKQREQISDDIIIYDVTEDVGDEENPVGDEENPMADEENIPTAPEANEDSTSNSSNCSHSPDIVIVEDDNEEEYAPVIQGDKSTESVAVPANDPLSPVGDSTSPLMSSAVQLNNQSTLTAEDSVSMMDSILSENGVISQNINLLGKVELLDYLDSIDCSLEDFQAMLSGRQFSIDPDLLVEMETKEIETTKNNAGPTASHETQVSKPKSDKQLIQYTAFPLLAFLDGNPGSTIESGSSAVETPSCVDKPLEVDELLESSLDPQPTQSKLVRLEPLTEAEASEATLFYLCELAPAPMDTDMPFLDN